MQSVETLRTYIIFLRNEDDSILWLEEDDMVLREAESMEEPAF